MSDMADVLADAAHRHGMDLFDFDVKNLAAALSAAGFGPAQDTLRDELVVYVELLEHLDANDEGIDGDAVPRELRDILARTTKDT